LILSVPLLSKPSTSDPLSFFRSIILAPELSRTSLSYLNFSSIFSYSPLLVSESSPFSLEIAITGAPLPSPTISPLAPASKILPLRNFRMGTTRLLRVSCTVWFLPSCFCSNTTLSRLFMLVYLSLSFSPSFFNVYWFVACTLSSSCSDALPLAYRILVLVFVFLIIGIVVWIIVANWHKIELTIQIISVASDALSKNLKLFVVLPLLILGLVVYYAPIVVFLVFARFNGKFVPRELDGHYFCEWKEDSWVPACLLCACHFNDDLVSCCNGGNARVCDKWNYCSVVFLQGRLNVSKSVVGLCQIMNAFGQSFGTICVSGLLICIVRVVRAIVDNAREENPQGIVNMVLLCCANALLGALDNLNKFTIEFAAITGEAYCTSAKMTYELLRRNLLSAEFVETVSTRILTGIVFVLSAAYAVATWGVLRGVSNLGIDSYVVAILAWLLLIEDVIDTIYVCYAIDRDKGDIC
ncbi:hypothetical protein ARALYDRAFT_493648, partial [Arabidopsis lyrata subsp. lyrata]